MCERKPGKRCDGSGGSYVPGHSLSSSLVSNDNTVQPPHTSAEAFHLVALSSRGYDISEHVKDDARQFDITQLSHAQMWQTWKTMAESDTPSQGLRTLHDLGYEHHFPELHDIRGVPQSPEWHPEGSVEKHIQESGDVAARNATHERLSKRDTHVAVLGAIAHDFGKSTHTQVDAETGKITSHGHDQAGVAKARDFLNRIGASDDVKIQVPVLVGEHMRHINNPSTKSAHKLSEKLKAGGTTLEAWTRVADADVGGRGSASEPSIAQQWIAKRDEAANNTPSPHDGSFQVNGKMLTDMGYTPGPHYKDMIHHANRAINDGTIANHDDAKQWVAEHYPQ